MELLAQTYQLNNVHSPIPEKKCEAFRHIIRHSRLAYCESDDVSEFGPRNSARRIHTVRGTLEVGSA